MTFPRTLFPAGVIRQGNIYVASSLVSQSVMLAAWLFLPWRLTADQLGQFALISFGTDMLMRLILMGADGGIIRFYVDAARRTDILRTAFAWVGVGCGVAALLLWVTRSTVAGLLAMAPIYSQVMWLMLASAAATALATTVFSHYQGSRQALRYASLSVLRSVLLASGYVTVAAVGFGLRGLLIVQIVASLAIVVVFCAAGGARHLFGPVQAPVMREMGGYGLPMVAYGVFSILSDYTGRLVLGHQVSLQELGVFQFYVQIASQVNGVWSSLNRAWTPHMFRTLHQSRGQARYEVTRAAALSTALYALGFVAVVLVGKAGLWNVVVAPPMAARVDVLYLLLLGPLYGAIYTSISPVLYFRRNMVRISTVQMGTTAAGMMLTVALTALFHAPGAALGWVLGNLLVTFVYLTGFRSVRSELRPVLGIFAIAVVSGTLAAVALMQFRADGLAALILCAGSLVILGTHDWREPPPQVVPAANAVAVG